MQNPGAQATKEAVEGATGLKINYWVLIDLKGFESLVDAVGGITMDVYRRVPIGGGSTKIYGYVEAGKNRHLNGREALWFARSRSDSSDYDRMVRQKCVMNAMLNQFDPITVLTKFNSIAAAGREVVATDIPTSEIGTMIDLALKAKALPVASVAIMPPLINPGAPDFDVVRQHRPDEDRDLRGRRGRGGRTNAGQVLRVRTPKPRTTSLAVPGCADRRSWKGLLSLNHLSCERRKSRAAARRRSERRRSSSASDDDGGGFQARCASSSKEGTDRMTGEVRYGDRVGTAWPGVTVVMPVLNEERHLEAAVRRVLDQDYPGELEVILAVGPSSDRTPRDRRCARAADPRIRVVDNPAARTPAALNLGIAASQHEIIVRVDGHGELTDGYIRRAVELLDETGAANVGGVMDAQGTHPVRGGRRRRVHDATGSRRLRLPPRRVTGR